MYLNKSSQGFIDIKAIVNVQADTASKDKHVFNIMTSDRTYVLQASSEDEVNYWYAFLLCHSSVTSVILFFVFSLLSFSSLKI